MVGGFELKVNKTAKIEEQKQMLIFNSNSTLKEFEKCEKKFRKSIKSITLK